MDKGGDVSRPGRGADGAFQGREEFGDFADRLDDVGDQLALISRQGFERVVPVCQLFHRHQGLDLPLFQGRVQGEDAPDVEQGGEEFVFRKGIGDFGRDVVVIQPEHLHRLVARRKIGDALGDQIGIEQDVGEGGAGAGVAAQREEFAVDLFQVVRLDGAGEKFDVRKRLFRPFDARSGAVGHEGDFPGERQDAQPPDFGEIIEHEGGILAARVEERDVETGFFRTGNLVDQGQDALQFLRLFRRPAHGASARFVEFETGQDEVVGAAGGAKARFGEGRGRLSHLFFRYDLLAEQFAENALFPPGQLLGQGGEDGELFFADFDAVGKELVPEPVIVQRSSFDFPAALQTVHDVSPFGLVLSV